MTLSLAAVFIPVLFMGGVLGRLFREFSVTICVAILISGVVSVTLTPMLCSRFLQAAAHGHGERRFGRATERGVRPWLLRGYDRTLQIVLRHRAATHGGVGRRARRSPALLFVIVPKGFIPEQDTDQIAVTTEAAQGTAFDKLVEYQDAVADIIRQDPNVEALVSTIGGSAAATLGGPNLGQIVVHLKPRSDAQELANDDHRDAAAADGQGARHQGLHAEPADHPDRRPGEQEPVSVLDAVARSQTSSTPRPRKLRKRAAAVPGLEDLTSDLAITSPQINVEIDRDKAAALGVTANQIENAFYDAYGPRWVSTIYAPVNEYKVLLELAPQFQADPAALSLLYFKSGTGRHRPGRAARHAGARAAGDRSADRQPLRPAGRRHDLVRSGARRLARRRVRNASAMSRHEPARGGQRAVPGSGQGIPELAVQSRGAAAHRGDGRLHRARDPLRELHPPADDSLGPAVGRLRRAGDADRLPAWTSTSTRSSA